MPVLDEERFIAAAIESVLGQSFDSWELLIIDDGSTDASLEIARDYAARHTDRIRCFSSESGRGASAARNVGIRNARGEIIALIDADDVWEPEKLAVQVPQMREQPEASLLYSNTLFWFSWTGDPVDRGRDFLPSLRLQPGRSYDGRTMLASWIEGTTPVPCAGGVLLRADAVHAVGGYEEAFVSLFTDQSFYAKLMLRGDAFVAGGWWDRYRQHPDSSYAVAKRTGRAADLRDAFLRWLLEYMDTNAISAPSVRRAIDRQLWARRHPHLARLARTVRKLGRPDLRD